MFAILLPWSAVLLCVWVYPLVPVTEDFERFLVDSLLLIESDFGLFKFSDAEGFLLHSLLHQPSCHSCHNRNAACDSPSFAPSELGLDAGAWNSALARLHDRLQPVAEPAQTDTPVR